MSEFYSQWQAYKAMQEKTMVTLFILGAGLAVGWLLLPRIIPARWVNLARWVFMASVYITGLLAFVWVGGQ